ncbi:hypothetical protein FLO80_19920 [Aquicoccus porphyridii]|uniref:Uncharacterized protein n=1 Tax=Aquicoccus porphyridii TaxID=1852029 RepID=A0A5A9YXZ3_9RHOB|nr:hypothetical protein [Aquicoccus porphyridii]KAA0909756.1 hypothetical protein FLO80_19920 [Aquicoccus porphyridii]RAI52887.1 hypothetical protein DOO74_15480 [Rhodobacteraceae bacterium AsT-22]
MAKIALHVAKNMVPRKVSASRTFFDREPYCHEAIAIGLAVNEGALNREGFDMAFVSGAL